MIILAYGHQKITVHHGNLELQIDRLLAEFHEVVSIKLFPEVTHNEVVIVVFRCQIFHILENIRHVSRQTFWLLWRFNYLRWSFGYIHLVSYGLK